MALTRTFAGATISIATALPTTFDDNSTTGYPSLTWQEHCVDAIPAINKAFAAVSKSTTCTGVDRDLKGSSKYDAVTYNYDYADNAQAQALYQAAFDSQTAEVAIRFKFALRDGETTPDTAYTTAQVAKFAETNGGGKDDIDYREIELWIQRELFKVGAA